MTEQNTKISEQDIQQVEQNIRQAVQSGEDVYQKVREITLKALTEHDLDEDNIKAVVEAISKGITAGLDTPEEVAKRSFSEAAEALDDALVSAAEATKLAVEEASSTVKEFSEKELKKTVEDLQALEDLFLDTLSEAAKEGSELAKQIVDNFVSHARNSGTAVGERVQKLVDALLEVKDNSEKVLVEAAVDTASKLAKIGSGILAGIAESLEARKNSK
jgi:predicted solute-binding protein